jgi:hypothetical protein
MFIRRSVRAIYVGIGAGEVDKSLFISGTYLKTGRSFSNFQNVVK